MFTILTSILLWTANRYCPPSDPWIHSPFVCFVIPALLLLLVLGILELSYHSGHCKQISQLTVNSFNWNTQNGLKPTASDLIKRTDFNLENSISWVVWFLWLGCIKVETSADSAEFWKIWKVGPSSCKLCIFMLDADSFDAIKSCYKHPYIASFEEG